MKVETHFLVINKDTGSGADEGGVSHLTTAVIIMIRRRRKIILIIIIRRSRR